MKKDRECYCTSTSSRLDRPELADQSIQRNIVAHIVLEGGNFAKRYHLMEGMPECKISDEKILEYCTFKIINGISSPWHAADEPLALLRGRRRPCEREA